MSDIHNFNCLFLDLTIVILNSPKLIETTSLCLNMIKLVRLIALLKK